MGKNLVWKSNLSRLMIKPTKWHVHLVKNQFRLGIRLVWLESSLSAWRKLGSLATHRAHREDSDQTGRMPRLIWVLTGRTVIFVAPVLAWAPPACKFPSVRPSIHPSVRQHLPSVSCERNSSYSFVPIFLKLYTCFCHCMRMCMWFGYNCEITFCHFFHFVNLVIFRPQCIDSGYLVSATPYTILYRSFWNFAHVFFMACGLDLDIILALFFVTFSTLRTLSFPDLRFYESV